MQKPLSALFAVSLLLAGSTALTPVFAQTAPVAPASTQTAPQPGQPGTMDELNAIVKIQSRPKAATQIPENQPVQLDLSLVNVPDVPKPLLEGVTGNAFARYVEVDKKLVGQMVLAGVSKDGKVEPLDTTKFAAQFPLKATTLSTDEPVVIEGDKVQLIEALKRLQGTKEEEKKEEAAQSEDKAASISNGNGSANPDAAGYTTPTPGTLPKEAPEPEPETTVEVSEDGCKIRVDLGQMAAIQQNKTITVTGGSRSETPCEDGGTRYPLQESFLNCTYKIDTEAMTATARKRLYYVDKEGQPVEAQDCTEDAERVYPITEDVAACPILLDYPAKKAVPQAVRTYTNHLGARVQLPGPCMDSKTVAAVPLVPTTDGCTIRHDYAAAQSVQQGRHTYTLNNVQYDAGFCTDTATVYPHTNIYDDAAGNAICAPLVDQAKRTVARQYRTRITVGGVSQYINDCTPDTAATALVTTQEGCEDPTTWVHDLSAGVSYGNVRDYWMRSGKREYLNACHTGTQTYPHQLAAVGWEMNDGNRTSLQKSKVTIAAPKGEYVIAASTVLPGTAALPYEYIGQATTKTGTSTYEGCTAWRETAKAEQYKRPDNTVYNLVIGAGTPENGGNVCSETVTPIKTYDFLTSAHRDKGDPDTCTYQITYTRRQAGIFNLVNNETGAIVSTSAKWMYPAYSAGGASVSQWDLGHVVYTDKYNTLTMGSFGTAICGSANQAVGLTFWVNPPAPANW